MLSRPPDELVDPKRKRTEQMAEVQAARDKLAKWIDKAVDEILFVDDTRTRQALDRKLTGWHDELERLDAELVTEPLDEREKWSGEELEALTEWWASFDQEAVSLPIPGGLPVEAHLHQDPEADEAAVLVDARKVQELLHQIGCVVKLYWKTEEMETRRGTINKYSFHRGRLQLGQGRKARINGKFELSSFHNVQRGVIRMD